MKLFNDCWIAILQLLDTLTLSTTGRSALQNSPAGLEINPSSTPDYPLPGTGRPNEGFIPFTPPSSAEDQDKSIACKYPSLGDEWEFCGEENRGCWIRNRKNSSELCDISTNYEEKFPPGVLRKFYLEASNIPIDADGVENKEGKVFNRTYPAPWIEACWGDVIEVTVKNNLRWNGTTVHWHGIRQLHTLEIDGVNAVTQCPIAPGQNYTYRFRAMQYGSSWYHSHYSMQYGDGLAGPMTIHGPSTANYTKAIDPILMTDWNHRSGFQDFQKELENKGPPNMDSILINGIGSYAGIAKGGKKFTTTFVKGTKYLLRLINTSVDTTFVFSIDSHSMTVIAADFVPIHPYITDHLVIGIGQRYHVVIEANPKYLIHQNAGYENSYGDYIDSPEAFWIRTIPANGCEKFLLGGKPDERQGIIRYKNPHERSPLDPSVPTTGRRNFSLQCRDEEFENLKPWRKWYVGGEKG